MAWYLVAKKKTDRVMLSESSILFSGSHLWGVFDADFLLDHGVYVDLQQMIPAEECSSKCGGLKSCMLTSGKDAKRLDYVKRIYYLMCFSF